MREGAVLYLARHARSAPGPELDPAAYPLSQEGRRQADALVERLEPLGIDAVVASPWPRARDTVAPFARAAGLAVTDHAGLRERAFGGWHEDFEGFVRRSFEEPTWAPEGAESCAACAARGLAALTELAAGPGTTTLIGTHGQVLALVLREIDPSFGFEAWRQMVFPDVRRVRVEGGRFVLDPDFRITLPAG